MLLLAIWGLDWARYPTPPPALIVSLVGLVAPFFIMQPGMGAGIASSKTPNPNAARLRSIVTHSVFGIGLYASALFFALMIRVDHRAHRLLRSFADAGERDGTRTHDLLIKSQLLYHLSYALEAARFRPCRGGADRIGATLTGQHNPLDCGFRALVEGPALTNLVRERA